jgi:hypothetical protein
MKTIVKYDPKLHSWVPNWCPIQVCVSNCVTLVGGYTLLYDNNIPIDMKYVDYDRNVNHLGSNEIVNLKIYTFVRNV